MNLSEMRTFVRDHAQTDAQDAPDSNLEVYARAAYRDIQSRVDVWPHLKSTYTFTTVAGQAEYPTALFTDTSLEYVLQVNSPDGVLTVISKDFYDEKVLEGSNPTTLYPHQYMVDVGSIFLYPTPSSAVTMTVQGYRQFATWPSGATEPDLPRGFDEVICWYMLGRYYQGQEDVELGIQYMRDYEIAVTNQIERALRSSKGTAGPKIFGGDQAGTGISYERWVRRNTEG